MPGVPVAVVDGAGLPVVYVREGALLVSPLAGELLTDEELGAMALQALSIRPGLDRSAVVRSGVNQPMVVTQLRAVVETVARLGGIDQAEVDRLMAAYGAPPELSRAGVK